MGGHSRSELALGLVGTDEASVALAKLASIRRLLLIGLACEAWLLLRYVPYSSHPGRYGVVAVAFLGCAIAGWRDRWARAALACAAALLLGVVVSAFPVNANHQFLALILLSLLLLCRDGIADDATSALQAMQWIVLIGLAWAGVMKLIYGTWFGGEFLSYRIAIDPGFARVLGPLVPSAELARLVALEPEIGAGPFRAEAPALVFVSNLTWIAELLLPIGLLWPRTRALALGAAIAFVFAIELGAREIFFGGMMIGLLLLFAERNRIAPAIPWITAVYVLWLLRPELAALFPGATPT